MFPRAKPHQPAIEIVVGDGHGDKGTDTVRLPRTVHRFCTYPGCEEPYTHLLSACREMHGICLRCNMRGHSWGNCYRYSPSRHARHFATGCDQSPVLRTDVCTWWGRSGRPARRDLGSIKFGGQVVWTSREEVMKHAPAHPSRIPGHIKRIQECHRPF